jgi:hypothetical protein
MPGCVMSEVNIEDPRNHPPDAVLELKDLLSGGATFIPDPKRRGFYEVESGSLVYYIHIAPTTCNVTLLATWPRGTEQLRTVKAA